MVAIEIGPCSRLKFDIRVLGNPQLATSVPANHVSCYAPLFAKTMIVAPMTVPLDPFSLERMANAVEKVRQRLLKASAALCEGTIPYAIAGGNAVALWVSRVDEAAVRNTQDVDVLLRRTDFSAARTALESAGFVYRHVEGMDLFLDSPDARPREAVHVSFANEFIRPHEAVPNPDVDQSEDAGLFRVLALSALVRIKLTAFRDKDRIHLRDLIDVGLIDAQWLEQLPPALVGRLRQLLDTPQWTRHRGKPRCSSEGTLAPNRSRACFQIGRKSGLLRESDIIGAHERT